MPASTFAECIRWMAGVGRWEEGRRNYLARLVSAFQFSASGNVHPVHARGPHLMLRLWRTLVSIAQLRFMELGVVGDGIKGIGYAGVHSEGIVAISPILLSDLR